MRVLFGQHCRISPLQIRVDGFQLRSVFRLYTEMVDAWRLPTT